MLFEPGQGPGYEPPSKKSREGPESRSPDPGPLDCSKPENNGADLRIRQVRAHILILKDKQRWRTLLPVTWSAFIKAFEVTRLNSRTKWKKIRFFLEDLYLALKIDWKGQRTLTGA